jgi:hypothetical protein
VWEGVVEVFELPAYKREIGCYGWAFLENGEEKITVVIETPPVKDPITTVRAYVASLGKKQG